MSFPQSLQTANAATGGDDLNVRDVADDLKHWGRPWEDQSSSATSVKEPVAGSLEPGSAMLRNMFAD